MSGIELTPAKRREMKRLGKLVDKATKADRLFFERRPDRQHRVRLSHQAEIKQNEIVGDQPLPARLAFGGSRLFAISFPVLACACSP